MRDILTISFLPLQPGSYSDIFGKFKSSPWYSTVYQEISYLLGVEYYGNYLLRVEYYECNY